MSGDETKVVGQYVEKFNQLTGQTLPCGNIYQSKGLLKHVEKRHPDETYLVSLIPSVLQAPDYIGKNPKEPHSIELVKVMGQNVMVCVKLDTRNGYLYVASTFSISQAKLENRIASGRLKAT